MQEILSIIRELRKSVLKDLETAEKELLEKIRENSEIPHIKNKSLAENCDAIKRSIGSASIAWPGEWPKEAGRYLLIFRNIIREAYAYPESNAFSIKGIRGVFAIKNIEKICWGPKL